MRIYCWNNMGIQRYYNYYRRYVDDTFCLFHSEQDATLTFNYINNQHPNIQWSGKLTMFYLS